MTRSALDKLISFTGLVMAAVLLLLGGGLLWAHNFIHTEVSDQLSAQNITFPAAESTPLTALNDEDEKAVSKYAGQSLTTGAQAKVYADNYIAAHIKDIGGGKSYAELSTLSRASPTDQELAGKVNTVFKGETLRGLLLNAYAFDTMATVARMAAVVSVVGAVLLAGLAALGYRHAGSVKKRR